MKILEFRVVKHVFVNKDITNFKQIGFVRLVVTHVCIVLISLVTPVNNVFKPIKEHIINTLMNVLVTLDIMMMK